jgi:tetratricopeptide (TPR) repeat protein
MTQMYGKFALILALAAFLLSPLMAQVGEPIPVLLNTQNEIQKITWQDDLTAAFGDQELAWVEAEQEADIVITYDNDSVSLFVRQNAVQRLSPILEPAPPVMMESDENVAVIAALLWPLVHGECETAEEATALDMMDAGLKAMYEANCSLIAAHAEDEPNEDLLMQANRQFDQAISIPAAKANWVWLVHEIGDKFYTRELISLEILNPEKEAKDEAFWYGKRAQFYALDFDYQAALRDVDRAIDADPENPLYPTLKGEVYLLLYEWNNAKAAFDAAIALDPDFALAYFQRGILLSTMTDIEGANADFSMYLALEPRGVYAEMVRQYMVGS